MQSQEAVIHQKPTYDKGGKGRGGEKGLPIETKSVVVQSMTMTFVMTNTGNTTLNP